ncbi:MAG: hypothetical protein ACR2OU_20935 [Thermomicrobiales bacterium]
MTRSFLTDEQKWQIVHAPREMTDDELATAFGQLRSTVHHRPLALPDAGLDMLRLLWKLHGVR